MVAKQSGENTVATADEVQAAAEGDLGRRCRRTSRRRSISDQSVFIKAAVDNIKRHLIEGSFFAAIIIFLFLANIRTTLIAAIAIPTSIISTFALMAAMGFTLNQITMLALTLMVGHRDRRRHHRARKHLPLHRREGHAAVPGGDPGHARKSAWR